MNRIERSSRRRSRKPLFIFFMVLASGLLIGTAALSVGDSWLLGPGFIYPNSSLSNNVAVNGTLRVYGQHVCLENGSYCPASSGNGSAGPAGTNGTDGLNGTRWTLNTTFPTSPNVNDSFLNTSTGVYWQWTGSSWVQKGNLTGPKGAQGSTGPQGDPGQAGQAGSNGTNGSFVNGSDAIINNLSVNMINNASINTNSFGYFFDTWSTVTFNPLLMVETGAVAVINNWNGVDYNDSSFVTIFGDLVDFKEYNASGQVGRNTNFGVGQLEIIDYANDWKTYIGDPGEFAIVRPSDDYLFFDVSPSTFQWQGINVCLENGTNCPPSGGGSVNGSDINVNRLNITTASDAMVTFNSSGFTWRTAMQLTGANFRILDPDGAVLADFNKNSDSATFLNLFASSSYNGAVAFTATGASGQTVDLAQFKNSSGSILARVNGSGVVNASQGLCLGSDTCRTTWPTSSVSTTSRNYTIASQTRTLNVPAPVLNLSIPVAANEYSIFECRIPFMGNTSTSGLALSLNITASTNNYWYDIVIPTSATALVQGSQLNRINIEVVGTAVAANGANHTAYIRGSINTSGAGSIIPRYRSEINGNNVTIWQGADCEKTVIA